MAKMFEYLQWRGDLGFDQAPVNAVDALILSTLAYISYGGAVEAQPHTPVTLRDAAEVFLSQEDLEKRCRVKNDLELLRQAAETRRFGEMKLVLYQARLVPEEETQFAAMTFLLADGTAFLAFRGTDYTLVGWKEDFNMSFQQTVPAQRLAAQYLQTVAEEYPLPLRLGGHSKGGNLAVFAAARSTPAVRERILEIYNNDGPGFSDAMMRDPGYLAVVPRIRTFIPQSSVIGMLLEHEEPYTVVRSTNVGLMQHDPYSWEVMGGSFLTVQEITHSSQFLDATIKVWFSGMTDQERNRLVDVLFGLLGSGSLERAADVFQPRNIRTYVKTLSGDEQMRHILSGEFLGLLEAAKQTLARFDAARLTPEEPAEDDL